MKSEEYQSLLANILKEMGNNCKWFMKVDLISTYSHIFIYIIYIVICSIIYMSVYQDPACIYNHTLSVEHSNCKNM